MLYYENEEFEGVCQWACMCVSMCRRGIPVYLTGPYMKIIGTCTTSRWFTITNERGCYVGRQQWTCVTSKHTVTLTWHGLGRSLWWWQDNWWAWCPSDALGHIHYNMATVLPSTPDFSMSNTSSWYLPASRWLAHPLISCSLELLYNTHNVNSLAVLFCRMFFAAHPTAIDPLMKPHATHTHTELCWRLYDAVTDCTS